MSFGRYTTPTIIMELPDGEYPAVDFTQADHVYVTFSSGKNSFTKTGDDLVISERSVGVILTQEETGRFRDYTEAQVNWTANGGMRYQSDIITLDVDRNLLERVVE